VRVCFVATEENINQHLHEKWKMTFPNEKIYQLESAYRSIAGPVLKFIDIVCAENKGHYVTVIFPEVSTAKWYYDFLHNQTAWYIKLALLYKKNVVVTSVRYQLVTT
jgi:hypothetical protein